MNSTSSTSSSSSTTSTRLVRAGSALRRLDWTKAGTEAAAEEDEEVATRSKAAKERLGTTSADLRTDGCIPGCLRKGQQCRDVHRGHNAYLCSFPPEQLQYALKAQLLRESFTNRNNEMVIDLSSVTPQLPGAIEAFFVVKGSPDLKSAYARNAYNAFMEYYHYNNPEYGPPLMVVDMTNPDEPFALDESLSESANAIPRGHKKG